jgi:hypothetical protein
MLSAWAAQGTAPTLQGSSGSDGLTLFLLQLLHFLFALTAKVAAPVFIAGMILAMFQVATPHSPPRRSTLSRIAVTVVLALPVAGWIASRSMMPPASYDAGLYHFNAIRWIPASAARVASF